MANPIEAWQKHLLPLMAGLIVFLTLFFFTASFFQLYYLHKQIQNSAALDLSQALKPLQVKTGEQDYSSRLASAKWQTLAVLEGHALQRRYHQANILLMSRIWTNYLGFVTGMILAFVGAVFILGKLKEDQASLGIKSTSVSGSFKTTSPGLMLALLGTILMTLTIVTRHRIDVADAPLYFPGFIPASDAAPAPATMEEQGIFTPRQNQATGLDTTQSDAMDSMLNEMSTIIEKAKQ